LAGGKGRGGAGKKVKMLPVCCAKLLMDNDVADVADLLLICCTLSCWWTTV